MKLGVQCSDRSILGSDALVVALIRAFRAVSPNQRLPHHSAISDAVPCFQFIMDYERPQDKAFGRDIESAIKPHLSFLTGGRSLPPAVGNLVKQLKQKMTSLPDDISDERVLHPVSFLSTFPRISLNFREKKLWWNGWKNSYRRRLRSPSKQFPCTPERNCAKELLF